LREQLVIDNVSTFWYRLEEDGLKECIVQNVKKGLWKYSLKIDIIEIGTNNCHELPIIRNLLGSLEGPCYPKLFNRKYIRRRGVEVSPIVPCSYDAGVWPMKFQLLVCVHICFMNKKIRAKDRSNSFWI